MGDVVGMSAMTASGGGKVPHAQRLSSRESRYVELISDGSSLSDAAKAVGISQRTGRRWRQRPAVEAAIKARAEEAISVTRATLIAGSAKAAHELARLSQTAKPDAARIQACRSIIALAMELEELNDLRARLVELEEAEPGQGSR